MVAIGQVARGLYNGRSESTGLGDGFGEERKSRLVPLGQLIESICPIFVRSRRGGPFREVFDRFRFDGR
jgi:hypothetical protein